MLTVPLLQSAEEIGTVKVREEGLYLRFTARTNSCMEGIRRAYLQFENGECLLGVMEPDGTAMCCTRCFAKQQLRCFGNLKSALLRAKDEEIWQSYDGRLLGRFGTKIPREGALQRREGDLRLIALPYAHDRPFPLTELFCLAVVSQIGGQNYVVYRFSEQGVPKI